MPTRQDRLNALNRAIEDAESPYERPEKPDLTINTTQLDLPKAVDQITRLLQEKKILG